MTYEDQAAQIVAEEFAKKDQYCNQETSFAYFRPWVIKQVAARLKAEDASDRLSWLLTLKEN